MAKLDSAKEVVKCLESQLQSLALQQLAANSSLENLFCVGSPLPVYLALRGVRPDSSSSPDKVMPRYLCRHIFNVFHPSDPAVGANVH
ncbi:unnamed protein product [Dibothriocephalus latus]|uniref:DDHD domain-containing protein n=1 Tax=Dibothriocephalus latus TaxID=60516 RepID=A0A3P7LI58_DIBLA|nr:unnamed protein product [Dibothriocephalus latus]